MTKFRTQAILFFFVLPSPNITYQFLNTILYHLKIRTEKRLCFNKVFPRNHCSDFSDSYARLLWKKRAVNKIC